MNVSEIAFKSAKLSATVKLVDSDIHYSFYCSENKDNVVRSSNYVNTSCKVESNTTQVEAEVEQLKENTLYYYCLVITLKNGQTMRSNVESFTTPRLSNYLRTSEATDITLSSASLGGWGNLKEIYKSDISYFIYYSKSASMTYFTSTICKHNGNELRAEVKDLVKNTNYYYCVAALIDMEEVMGDIKSFKTKDDEDYFATGNASNITLTTAQIDAESSLKSIFPNASIHYRVQYSKDQNGVKTSSASVATIDNNTLSTTLQDLAMNTTYYCCIANVDGTEYIGQIKNFKTLSAEGCIVTGEAYDIMLTSAKINGSTKLPSLTNNHSSVQYFVRYSTNNDMSSPMTSEIKVDGGRLSATLSNLSLNSKYYYCCVAIVDGNEIKGGIKNFTTLSGIGTVVTGTATEISFTSANISGSTSLSNVTTEDFQCFVRYSINQNMASSKSMIATISGNTFTTSLSGLSMNTVYYYYCYAIVNGYEIKGEIKTFKTLSASIQVVTGNATNVTETSAIINGTTSAPNNKAIQYFVRYSANQDFLGAKTVEASSNGANLTATISNLAVATIYYYYYVASFEEITVEGKIKQFQTTDSNITNGFVDLGLSCKWASHNIDADNATSAGNYYAWGETGTKSNYNSASYKYKNKDIGSDIAGTEYDVAFIKEKGRIPTKKEFQELVDECTWESTTYMGVTGYLITGKNGNKIFLPSTGRIETATTYYGDCMYWTSNSGGSIDKAYSLKNKSLVEINKFIGLPIRPVQ